MSNQGYIRRVQGVIGHVFRTCYNEGNLSLSFQNLDSTGLLNTDIQTRVQLSDDLLTGSIPNCNFVLENPDLITLPRRLFRARILFQNHIIWITIIKNSWHLSVTQPKEAWHCNIKSCPVLHSNFLRIGCDISLFRMGFKIYKMGNRQWHISVQKWDRL